MATDGEAGVFVALAPFWLVGLSPVMTELPQATLRALGSSIVLLVVLGCSVRVLHVILVGRMTVARAVRWLLVIAVGVVGAILATQGTDALRHPHLAEFRSVLGSGWFHVSGLGALYSSWLGVAVVWLVALILAGIIGRSGINHWARRTIAVVGPVGGLAIAWVVFMDVGRVISGIPIPPLQPAFFALWGLAILGVLPVAFALLGGIHTNTYHPSWKPFAMLMKVASLLASLLSIWDFVTQHNHF